MSLSKSYWHTPIMGITGRNRSCKAWRSAENGKYSAHIRDEISQSLTGSEYPHGRWDNLPKYCGRFGNEWDSPRDGKFYFGESKYYRCPHKYMGWGRGCTDTRHSCFKWYKQMMRK